jgi:pyrimidine-nucleoside phosphorylase
MIERQGGDARITDDYARLPTAPARAPLTAPRGGYVTAMGAEALGMASNILGAGRSRVGDPVDHAVGIVTRVRVGDRVDAGQVLLDLHHRDGHGLDEAQALCVRAVQIGDAAGPHHEHVLAEVR